MQWRWINAWNVQLSRDASQLLAEMGNCNITHKKWSNLEKDMSMWIPSCCHNYYGCWVERLYCAIQPNGSLQDSRIGTHNLSLGTIQSIRKRILTKVATFVNEFDHSAALACINMWSRISPSCASFSCSRCTPSCIHYNDILSKLYIQKNTIILITFSSCDDINSDDVSDDNNYDPDNVYSTKDVRTEILKRKGKRKNSKNEKLQNW